jgi:hypothetical protein
LDDRGAEAGIDEGAAELDEDQKHGDETEVLGREDPRENDLNDESNDREAAFFEPDPTDGGSGFPTETRHRSMAGATRPAAPFVAAEAVAIGTGLLCRRMPILTVPWSRGRLGWNLMCRGGSS